MLIYIYVLEAGLSLTSISLINLLRQLKNRQKPQNIYLVKLPFRILLVSDENGLFLLSSASSHKLKLTSLEVKLSLIGSILQGSFYKRETDTELYAEKTQNWIRKNRVVLLKESCRKKSGYCFALGHSVSKQIISGFLLVRINKIRRKR